MRTVLFLSWCTAAVGCQRSATPTATCPSVAVLEDLHAASFYLDHGPRAKAVAHLDRAQKAIGNDTQPGGDTRDILSALMALSAEDDITKAEALRLRISSWACLSDDKHAEFHRRLPPL